MDEDIVKALTFISLCIAWLIVEIKLHELEKEKEPAVPDPPWSRDPIPYEPHKPNRRIGALGIAVGLAIVLLVVFSGA